MATTDRGRDVSEALTEVRTVHKHALSAIERLSQPTEFVHHPATMGADGYESPWTERITDPDAADMIEALTQVTQLLERWKRTGRV